MLRTKRRGGPGPQNCSRRMEKLPPRLVSDPLSTETVHHWPLSPEVLQDQLWVGDLQPRQDAHDVGNRQGFIPPASLLLSVLLWCLWLILNNMNEDVSRQQSEAGYRGSHTSQATEVPETSLERPWAPGLLCQHQETRNTRSGVSFQNGLEQPLSRSR